MTAPCPIHGLTEEQANNLWRLYSSSDEDQRRQAEAIAKAAGVEIPTIWVVRRYHMDSTCHRVMTGEAVITTGHAIAQTIGRLRDPMARALGVVTIQARGELLFAVQAIANSPRCAEMPYTIPPTSQKTR